MATNDLDPAVYNLCRLSCLAFMQLVLYPQESANNAAENILRPLINAILRYRTNGPPPHDRQLVFWSHVLALMLAYEHRLARGTSKFINELVDMFDATVVPLEVNSWPVVRQLLNRYIWMGSESDKLGQVLWSKILVLGGPTTLS